MAILESVFNAVNDDWSPPSAIYERLNIGAPTTMRSMLLLLNKFGLIERRQIDGHIMIFEYRRTTVKNDPLTEKQMFSAMLALRERRKAPCPTSISPAVAADAAVSAPSIPEPA